MFKRKKSLFGRLTGGLRLDEDVFEDELQQDDIIDDQPAHENHHIKITPQTITEKYQEEIEDDTAELSIDLYDNGKEIIIQTMIAGVKPDEVEVDIRRDSISIKGTRKESKAIKEENYFYRELFWGSFSRTIQLPEEVDPEAGEATEKHGLLIIRLPKIDKEKQKKVKVKSI
jgi:HSP20 family protein